MENRYRRIFLIVIMISLTSCKTKKDSDNHKKESLGILKAVNSIEIEEITPKKKILDIFDVDSLRIRNFKTNIDINVFKLNWKNSDSIKTYIANCGPLEGKTVREFYYKGIIFELFDERANLREIDFTKNNNEIKHPRIVLNEFTSIKEVEKFKNSFLNKYVYNKGTDKYVKMKFLTKEGWDDLIVLVFKNGILIEFYFSDLPC